MSQVFDKIFSIEFLILTLVLGTIQGVAVNLLTDRLKAANPNPRGLGGIAVNVLVWLVYLALGYVFILTVALKLWHLIDGTSYYSTPRWWYLYPAKLLAPIWLGSLSALVIAAVRSFAARASSAYEHYPFHGLPSTFTALVVFSYLTYAYRLMLAEA